MLTSSAARSAARRRHFDRTVASIQELIRSGWTYSDIRAEFRANRWQRIGRAIVLHNGVPNSAELRRAALIFLGPRGVLTAFSALDEWGLEGWKRDQVHVLVPGGARVVRPAGLPLRVHYTGDWSKVQMHISRRLHRPAPAAVLAASTFALPRPACGILAATVQQRLIRPADLIEAIERAPRVRHRAALLAATHDIAQGAHALSEIDFARLCRSASLPEPSRQAIRKDRSGKRRYLDVEWDLPDGRRVVVEVDGALHLAVTRWWQDQLRQNEVSISGRLVLRYPRVVV